MDLFEFLHGCPLLACSSAALVRRPSATYNAMSHPDAGSAVAFSVPLNAIPPMRFFLRLVFCRVRPEAERHRQSCDLCGLFGGVQRLAERFPDIMVPESMASRQVFSPSRLAPAS
jgi:hypothetical protein